MLSSRTSTRSLKNLRQRLLLLPPNALPSIYVKTTSPRMKPSRQSFIAPRPGEDNPVFTLAVYERSANKQLWRVEKTFQSLATLDATARHARHEAEVGGYVAAEAASPVLDAGRAAVAALTGQRIRSLPLSKARFGSV